MTDESCVAHCARLRRTKNRLSRAQTIARSTRVVARYSIVGEQTYYSQCAREKAIVWRGHVRGARATARIRPRMFRLSYERSLINHIEKIGEDLKEQKIEGFEPVPH